MATARLGNYAFGIDPSTAKWGYELKTNKIQTKGGTVVQIIARNIGDLTITGYLSARGLTNENRYQRMEEFQQKMADIMQYHVDTGNPVAFYFPVLGWNGKVFLKDVSKFSYSPKVAAISYQLTFFVDTGFDTIKEIVATDALNAIPDGVGWTRSVYNTPDTNNWEDMLKALKQVVENSGSYDAYGASLYEQYEKIRQNDDGEVTTDDGVVRLEVSGGTSEMVRYVWNEDGSYNRVS